MSALLMPACLATGRAVPQALGFGDLARFRRERTELEQACRCPIISDTRAGQEKSQWHSWRQAVVRPIQQLTSLL
jgi:hypothetical protein